MQKKNEEQVAKHKTNRKNHNNNKAHIEETQHSKPTTKHRNKNTTQHQHYTV